MDLRSLIGPAVVAAVIAAIVSVIGFLINRRTVLSMHNARLAADRELAERRNAAELALAERKFEHDRDLADRRATADEALTERRFQYERDLTISKRRMELAEQTLADFYEARGVITEARSPGGFSGEGRTRQREDWETEEDARHLNSYFRTIERLNSKEEFFAQLYARRYRFRALFGQDGLEAYEELFKVRWGVIVACRMLIDTYRNRTEGSLPENRQEWEKVIGWRPIGEDPIATRLDRAVEGIERICRPAMRADATA